MRKKRNNLEERGKDGRPLGWILLRRGFPFLPFRQGSVEALWPMSSRLPLNIQAALADGSKRRADDEIKPKFVSREERERLEMERRETEEERRRQEQLEEQQRRQDYLSGKIAGSQDMEVTYESTLSKEELDAIKQRHLGGTEKKVKKLRRFGDRRKLFDWEDEDDTGTTPAYTAIMNIGRASVKSKHDLELTEAHWTRKRLSEMKERDWRILKEDYNISTQGGSIPHPIRFWDESGLGNLILDSLDRYGFEEPTPIQRQAIPIALQKRDLIGIAETGSGKTLAFLLPMLSYIATLPRLSDERALDGPYGLILAPTRELALQIEQETKRFGQAFGFRSVAIVGGHSVSEQSMHLRRGVEIVIATPGRLRDCLEQHVLVLNQCYSVVLDEADRMIDMNFEEDLNFILQSLPANNAKPDSEAAERPEELSKYRFRQMTMFSATMPPSVERLAKLYLRRPVIVTVGNAGQAVDRITQTVEIVAEHEKPNRLISVLKDFSPPMIIFVNQKSTVDALYSRLTAHGYKAIALHGGKGQDQREAAISQLKQGTKDILIATDVASRGIDVKDISLVLNYDMAKTIEDYVHRIGRTGRAGKQGAAMTFVNDRDTDVFYDLRVMLQKSANANMPPEFVNHEAARQKPGTVQQKRRHEEQIFAYGV